MSVEIEREKEYEMKYQITRLDYDGTKEQVRQFKLKRDAVKYLWQQYEIARGYYKSMWKQDDVSYVVYDSENDHVLFTCYVSKI